MDKIEARDVLVAHLRSFRARRYGDLVGLIGHVQVAEVVGRSGTEYQIEVEVMWDSPRKKTNVRVIGSIDDGHLPRRSYRCVSRSSYPPPDLTGSDQRSANKTTHGADAPTKTGGG